VSVNPPALTIALGSVGIPQVDVIDGLVHLGATKEVSSWELRLQNWNAKYSPNGTYPLNAGQDGYICIGRGANVPQLITTRTESIKYQSNTTENYVIVAGRCWGEKLFRQTVTKDYSGYRGEAIAKDLLDYYSGLSHVRGSTELVEDTDTTFTDLKVQDTQVWDMLQKIAFESDKNGAIGYDFRTAPDGKFEFFPRSTKTSSVSLTDKIEAYEYWKEIIAIRNKITIYGAADKSSPLDKAETVESLSPASGAWTLYAGISMTLDATKTYGEAAASIKLVSGSNYYGGLYLTFNTPQNLNTYPKLYLALLRDTHIRADGFSVELFDTSYRAAGQVLSNVNDNDPSAFALDVGGAFAANWHPQAGFDWTQVSVVRIDGWLVDTLTSGTFWVMQLFFGGARYSSMQQNTASQAAYGLREFVDTDEELWSDTECLLRARAILANMKDPSEYITLRSTVIDYGNTPLFAADMIPVTLPNENVNGNFRILSAEYHVKAKTDDLEITLELGREKSLLADYVYALRSKVDHINRYKVARL